MIRALLRQPHPDEPATFAGTLQDAIAGVVIVLLIPVAMVWLPELMGWFQ